MKKVDDTKYGPCVTSISNF